MEEANIYEVRIQLESENRDFETWKNGEKERVKLTVSFDMGQNKRNSGNRYDSLSGHAFMCGCWSNMIVSTIITAKECRLCSDYEIQGQDSPSHDYPRNYTGVSKAMESDAVLSLYESMFYDSNKKIT